MPPDAIQRTLPLPASSFSLSKLVNRYGPTNWAAVVISMPSELVVKFGVIAPALWMMTRMDLTDSSASTNRVMLAKSLAEALVVEALVAEALVAEVLVAEALMAEAVAAVEWKTTRPTVTRRTRMTSG